MTDNNSIKDGSIIPEDKNRQLSLPAEMVNRGLEIASRIEFQSNIQKYQKPIRYFSGTRARSLIDFSKDGKVALITANSNDNPDLIIWNVSNGTFSNLSSLEKGFDNLGYLGHGRIWSMTLSSHGNLALVGYDTYDMLCWDVNNGQVISRHMRGWNTEPIEYLQFLPESEQCVEIYNYGASIIDAKSGETIRYIDGINLVNSLVFSKDGTQLLVATHELKILDIENKREPKIFKGAINIEAASMFPEPGKIVSMNSGGLITVWNTITGEVISQWFHANPSLPSEAGNIIPEEQWMFFTLDDEIQKERHNNNWGGIERMIRCKRRSVDVSPDGTKILSGGGDNYMHLWTLDGQEICRYPHYTYVVKVAFLPDGCFALSGCLDGSVYLWELPG
jgi:WD40 repeat protein